MTKRQLRAITSAMITWAVLCFAAQNVAHCQKPLARPSISMCRSLSNAGTLAVNTSKTCSRKSLRFLNRLPLTLSSL